MSYSNHAPNGYEMRELIVAGLLAACACAAVASPAAPQASRPPLPPPAARQAPALTDEVIRKAVRETIAENPQPVLASRDAGTFSAGTAQERMRAAFEQAKVPGCLHGDALKHQPAHIGPVNVVGPYSLPWVIGAALRGKCN